MLYFLELTNIPPPPPTSLLRADVTPNLKSVLANLSVWSDAIIVIFSRINLRQNSFFIMAMLRKDFTCPIFGHALELPHNVLPTYEDVMLYHSWISRNKRINIKI